jgi:Helix-turn-helix domain
VSLRKQVNELTQAAERASASRDDIASDGLALAVGAAVRTARTRAGLTMAELGGRAGVTQAFVSQLESGRSIRVHLQGARSEVLAAGDCLYYPASIPHRWEVTGQARAGFLVIAAPSSF